MNTILEIIFIEAVIFTFILVLTLYYIGYRNKKKHLANIDQLVNQIGNNESLRRQELIDCLAANCQLEQQAEEFCEDLIAAEKLFLYQFIEQQLKQSSLAEFNTQLNVLLDKYLTLLPLHKMQHTSSTESIVETHSEDDDTHTTEIQETDPQEEDNAIPDLEMLEEPTEESAPTTDEDMLDNESADDDPDWNEAFTETELEIDTK
jgi:hypothetical protein